MLSRRLAFPIEISDGKRPYVKVTSKFVFVQVLLHLFPQQYFYYEFLWIPMNSYEFLGVEHETDLYKAKKRIGDMNLHKKTRRIQPE